MSRKKHKITVLFILFASFILCSMADELVISVGNKTGGSLFLNYISSNKSSEFDPVEIPSGESKKIETGFADSYVLNLCIKDSDGNKISDFQIFNKNQYNRSFGFYIPGGGALTGWGCAWNTNRIKVRKLSGQRSYAWLNWVPLFSPHYYAEVDIEVIPEPLDIQKGTLEFTLFAVPKKDTIEVLELDTSGYKSKKLDKTNLNFQYWGIEEYVSLKPAVYKTDNNEMLRWVDLIIHNYTMSSFLFYGLEEVPESDHIELAYKEGFLKDYTVFYPPQTQLRGPGFKFQAKKEGDYFVLHPESLTDQTKKDKYYLIIGKQTNLNENKLDYIPLEITTGSRLGYALENGVKVNAHEDYAYEVEFIPVNAQFSLNSANLSEISEKIRVPLDKDGELAFQLSPMENISIETEFPNNDSKQHSGRRVAQKYIVSGKSKNDGVKYSFRLLLIAPPFLAGNTPGRFFPGVRRPVTPDTGNFLRYPLHLYVMALDEDHMENNIDSSNTVTELPENLIGSIEYFISDKDMIIKDDTDTEIKDN